jgi:CDP-glycerol glycerophosphotransferase (TagB/SpsB family)
VLATGGDLFAWTFSEKDSAHLIDSVRYADLIVFTFSTMLVDSTAAGKPGIAIGYDANTAVPYWHSIVRQYGRDYYRYALSFGGVPLVKNEDEFFRAVRTFLDDPDYLKNERRALQQALVPYRDASSAERVASAIVALV